MFRRGETLRADKLNAEIGAARSPRGGHFPRQPFMFMASVIPDDATVNPYDGSPLPTPFDDYRYWVWRREWTTYETTNPGDPLEGIWPRPVRPPDTFPGIPGVHPFLFEAVNIGEQPPIATPTLFPANGLAGHMVPPHTIVQCWAEWVPVTNNNGQSVDDIKMRCWFQYDTYKLFPMKITQSSGTPSSPTYFARPITIGGGTPSGPTFGTAYGTERRAYHVEAHRFSSSISASYRMLAVDDFVWGMYFWDDTATPHGRYLISRAPDFATFSTYTGATGSSNTIVRKP